MLKKQHRSLALKSIEKYKKRNDSSFSRKRFCGIFQDDLKELKFFPLVDILFNVESHHFNKIHRCQQIYTTASSFEKKIRRTQAKAFLKEEIAQFLLTAAVSIAKF